MTRYRSGPPGRELGAKERRGLNGLKREKTKGKRSPSVRSSRKEREYMTPQSNPEPRVGQLLA